MGHTASHRSAQGAKNAARKQFQRIEKLRSTAYQVAVEDMKHAGINPLLAIHQGGASGSAPGMAVTPNYAADQAAGINATSGAVTAATKAYGTFSEAQLRKTQAKGITSASGLADEQTILAGQKTQTEIYNTDRARTEAEIAKYGVPKAEFDSHKYDAGNIGVSSAKDAYEKNKPSKLWDEFKKGWRDANKDPYRKTRESVKPIKRKTRYEDTRNQWWR